MPVPNSIYSCMQIMERIDDVVFCLNERCFTFLQVFISQWLTSRKEEGFVQGGRICAVPLTLWGTRDFLAASGCKEERFVRKRNGKRRKNYIDKLPPFFYILKNDTSAV